MMARRAADQIPEIRRVILFGSMVTGIATPRSDADFLIEVEGSSEADPRDRAARITRAMSPLACPVDLFVYTTIELGQLDSPVIDEAIQHGVDLLT